MDLKTIAPDSRTAVIERKEFKGGYNDGRGGPPQTRADRIGRMPIGRRNFLRAGLNEVSLQPDRGRIRMGDDGGRLTNKREDPGNQGSEIETFAAGSGTHSKRRNGKYR